MLQLLIEILGILAPAAILALIGVLWAKKDLDYPIQFVTTLVIQLGMPALLFHTLATSTVDLSSLRNLVFAALAVHAVFTVIAICLLRIARKDWRLCIAHVCGNTGNLGLPVCFFAYGEAGLAYAMAFFSLQCLLLFSVGEAVLAGNASIKPALRSPILHSVWVGTLVRYMDIPVPQFVMDTTSLLGQLVIPIMLITLGVSLAKMTVQRFPATVLWSLVRTAVALLVGFSIATLFGLEGVARGVLIIETAVPVAVFNYLLAVRHNRDSDEVAGLILVTHLSAIVYLPLLLGVLLT